ncbi:hypothetical protein SAMN05444280_14025 [Tangfeifania diversioriginum]|uniref:Uncharacterized protein n=1 Tax=Tangfeifania diversioriginum TaxID=1168035 RepID=A0A1M6N8H7_9BACT|nr:hypothetical protein [Tangfeifania diversioriginum]SHJ91992.1 hypothetical protein SAMN05444280_14025 [Tangfeifania diversioriginum]
MDKSLVGFLAGFSVPVIIFLAVYLLGEKDVSFSKYVNSLWHLQALVKLGSLCVFANLLVFMGFIKINYERAARGVLGATIIYALAILISKTF